MVFSFTTFRSRWISHEPGTHLASRPFGLSPSFPRYGPLQNCKESRLAQPRATLRPLQLDGRIKRFKMKRRWCWNHRTEFRTGNMELYPSARSARVYLSPNLKRLFARSGVSDYGMRAISRSSFDTQHFSIRLSIRPPTHPPLLFDLNWGLMSS